MAEMSNSSFNRCRVGRRSIRLYHIYRFLTRNAETIFGNSSHLKSSFGLFWKFFDCSTIEIFFSSSKLLDILFPLCIFLFLIFKIFRRQDFHSKTRFYNQVWSYFANIERWLSHTVKVPKSITLAMNIYRNVGQMFFKIPEMLYTKVGQVF